MKIMTGTLISIIVFMVLIIFLQIFLSRKNSKWLGLILPIIAFLYSLLMLLSLSVDKGMGVKDILIMVLSTLLITNIPTLVLGGVYLACKEKMKSESEIEKMNIHDLE